MPILRPKRPPTDVVFEPVMRSAPMRRLDRMLAAVAPKEVTITLVGESGTGKEILARRVHEISARRRGPFVPINCAAIPDALFESELFGHERGAFTGASERVRGKVEAAEGGTLFLDEIGEMPLPMQAKLLRFLENRRFMRVGGSSKIEADLRLVFATLRPLQQEVHAGRFRADLFYRIQGITLQVPPLRDRRADVVPLLHQFDAELSARHGTKRPRYPRSVKAAFLEYDWPGNVRELRNTVEMLCLLRSGKKIRLRDLPESMQTINGSDRGSFTENDAPGVDVDLTLDRIIDRAMHAALRVERGNRSRAAARLGVSVRTIQRFIARAGLDGLTS